MRDAMLAALLGTVAVPIVAGAMTGLNTQLVDLVLWTIAGVVWVVAARGRTGHPAAVVAGAGLISGILAGAMQAMFLGVLVANNAAWAEYSVDPATRFQAFYTAVPIGFVWGLLFGGIAWLVARLDRNRRAAAGT